MARPAAARVAPARTAEAPVTRDVQKLREFLRRGAPGPYAHVVLLGLDTFDAARVLAAVKKGLPYHALERFADNSGLSTDDLLAMVAIPRRTLTRRKRDGRLPADESDRLLRAARVFAQALGLFEGDRDAAASWLTSPQPALGGATPAALAGTEVGAREIERLIGRLEHGVFS
jgi:putative toxin-antitoxin system antitoxin component (TIGR02293 family)